MPRRESQIMIRQSNVFLRNDRFIENLEVCHCEVGQVLAEADQPIRQVYFPITAVVSLVVPMEEEKNVEVALVGREGIIGLPVALDTRQHLKAVVQIPGEVYRLDPGIFSHAVRQDHELNRLLGRFILVRLQQVAQTAACNQLHRVQQRLCRWLLMCHDRVGVDQFPLTHQFLSQMLGIRRATVSDAAARLQLDGVIKYKRGQVTIADRERLEKRACACYRVIQREIERLLD